MGKLRITDQGLKLYHGEAEFVNELRANLIRPSQVRCDLCLYSNFLVRVFYKDYLSLLRALTIVCSYDHILFERWKYG